MTIDEQIAAVRAMAEELPGVHHNLDSKTMKFWIWGGKKFQWELHAWRYGVDEGVIKESLATAHRFLCSLKRGVNAVDFINDEPEFLGKMPDELSDRFYSILGHGIVMSAVVEFCRVLVRVTKAAMINRLGPAPKGMHYELCLMPDDTKEANDAKR